MVLLIESVDVLSSLVFVVGFSGVAVWLLLCVLCLWRFWSKLFILVEKFFCINCLCCLVVCVLVLVVRNIFSMVFGKIMVFMLCLFVMRFGVLWNVCWCVMSVVCMGLCMVMVDVWLLIVLVWMLFDMLMLLSCVYFLWNVMCRLLISFMSVLMFFVVML